MPFRRRRRRRVRRRRKGGKALRAVRALSKFVDKEMHLVDAGINFQQQIAIQFRLINAIPDGTLFNQRNGEQITMRSLRLKMMLRSGNSSVRIRVLLVYDKQPNGVLMTEQQLFQNVGTEFQVLVSPINHSLRKRYTILMDRLVNVNPVQNPVVILSKRLRMNHKTRYTGPGIAIADIDRGSLYLVTKGMSAGGAASPVIDFSTRLRFAP